jgi:hypothetical protein
MVVCGAITELLYSSFFRGRCVATGLHATVYFSQGPALKNFLYQHIKKCFSNKLWEELIAYFLLI